MLQTVRRAGGGRGAYSSASAVDTGPVTRKPATASVRTVRDNPPWTCLPLVVVVLLFVVLLLLLFFFFFFFSSSSSSSSSSSPSSRVMEGECGALNVTLISATSSLLSSSSLLS